MARPGKGRSLENPTRDAIEAEAARRFRRHPERPNPTQYMSIFVTRTGVPFAIDRSARSKQPIWVPAHLVASGLLEDIARDHYPADRTRNSNLNVAGLRVGSELVRFYPRTAEEASRIMDIIDKA